MNTTFPDNEMGKLIAVKLEEYEKANDSDAIQQQSLILTIYTVAKAAFAFSFVGLVGGCIVSAVAISWVPFLVTLGTFAAASVILSVFHRAVNISEISSYDLLKRIKDNWGSSSVKQDLRLLTIDAEGRQDVFKRLNEEDNWFNQWADILALEMKSESYTVAKFLGVPFEEIHQNLLSLSPTAEQEVKV